MKVIVAFLLILCVSCGTAAAQSSPTPTPSPAPTLSPAPTATPAAAPTATPAPDYRPCISALAFALVNHVHEVNRLPNPGLTGEFSENTGVIPAPPSFTAFPRDTPLSTVIAQFCVGAIDEAVLSQLAEITGN